MNKIILTAVLVSILFISCEEQMIMIPEPPTPPEGRVMLLEDYTGVRCVPCFGAHVLVDGYLEANPGSIVTYGVHGDLQSIPYSESKYDFRYPNAKSLELASGIFGKPSASFNRVKLPSGNITQPAVSSWSGFIDAELEKEQVAEIKMLSTYNDVTRQAAIDVTVVPRENISGDVDIHVVITESHLVDPQAAPNSAEGYDEDLDYVPEFDHKHVLKEMLTGLTGASLASNLVTGQDYRYNISYTLPEEANGEWIPENIEVVAFITAKDRDDEVQQAFQIHMTE